MVNTLLKVSQQTVWQLVGKVVTSLSTIIILGLVTRSYGESGTGVLTLALTFISFFVLAADFGINAHILPRFLEKDFSLEWRKLLGLRLVLSLALVILAGVVILSWPGPPFFKQAVLLGLVAIVESAVFATCAAVFQSKLRYDFSVASIIIGTLVTLGGVFFLAGQHITESWLMVGYSAGWITGGVIALILVKKYITNLSPVFDLTYAKRIIKEAWPISLTLMLNIVYFRLDAFIISFYRGFAEVGIYNLAYQIFQSLLVVPTFIMNGFYPLMLQSFAESRSKFTSQLLRAVFLMLGLAVMGMVFTITLAPWVINLITGGRGFVGSIQSLQILSLGFPAFFVSSVLMWTLVVMKRYKTMLVIYVAGLIVNGALNMLLIPRYSYIASSWITGASEYLILALQLIILIPLLRQWKK